MRELDSGFNWGTAVTVAFICGAGIVAGLLTWNQRNQRKSLLDAIDTKVSATNTETPGETETPVEVEASSSLDAKVDRYVYDTTDLADLGYIRIDNEHVKFDSGIFYNDKGERCSWDRSRLVVVKDIFSKDLPTTRIIYYDEKPLDLILFYKFAH